MKTKEIVSPLNSNAYNITHHNLLSCSLVQSSHEISDSGICYLLMVLLKMNHAKNWLFPHAVQSLQ